MAQKFVQVYGFLSNKPAWRDRKSAITTQEGLDLITTDNDGKITTEMPFKPFRHHRLSQILVNTLFSYRGLEFWIFFHLPMDKLDFIFYFSAAYVHLPKYTEKSSVTVLCWNGISSFLNSAFHHFLIISPDPYF